VISSFFGLPKAGGGCSAFLGPSCARHQNSSEAGLTTYLYECSHHLRLRAIRCKAAAAAPRPWFASRIGAHGACSGFDRQDTCVQICLQPITATPRVLRCSGLVCVVARITSARANIKTSKLLLRSRCRWQSVFKRAGFSTRPLCPCSLKFSFWAPFHQPSAISSMGE